VARGPAADVDWAPNTSSRQMATPATSITSATAARPSDAYTSVRSPATAPTISRPIAIATTETIAPNLIT